MGISREHCLGIKPSNSKCEIRVWQVSNQNWVVWYSIYYFSNLSFLWKSFSGYDSINTIINNNTSLFSIT